ncbi:MAG: 6-bladed beta-propeller [Dysgonamonadaceae bacterium]|jgi:hypothetical protein|nr:6-bladed beta-propeller [Dysgonamonadaceae bacterium]
MKTRMKSLVIICLWMAGIFSICAQSGNPLVNCKEVAKRVKIGGNDLVVCDRSLLNNTISVPLSALTEELQIVKLDDADAALVKETGAIIGDNHILVIGSREIPFKLFDKKTGKFLNNIGAFGQGPNEYQNIYDAQLDEKNNRIYLLPWQTKRILVYDLKGNALDPIPLYTGSPKGKFKVDTKAGTVIVSILPFTGAPAVVWTQTTQGKLIHSVAPGHLAVPPDFSNEVSAFKVGSAYGFNVFTFDPRTDSLYRYESASNKLIPVFTMKFNDSKQPIHSYTELTNYYMGDFSEPKKQSEQITVTQNRRYYIIDKKTLKGSFLKLENDFLGNVEIDWPNYAFSGDYFVRNVDPGNLSDVLEKVLKENKKLTAEQKTKLTKLKNSITDNDNNYILYAKLKR